MSILKKSSWALGVMVAFACCANRARATPIVNVITLGTNPVDNKGTSAIGFTAYLIQIVTNNGALITGVDAGGAPGADTEFTNGLFGPFLQKWNFANDDPSSPTGTGRFSPPAASSLDSHILVPTTVMDATALPAEDNTLVNPPGSPPDNGDIDYGTGTKITATFGIIDTAQSTSLDLAYVVLPTGSLGSYVIDIATSDSQVKTVAAGVIPEPMSSTLLSAGLVATLVRRRRK